MNWPKKVTPADVPFGFAIASVLQHPLRELGKLLIRLLVERREGRRSSELTPDGNIRPKLDCVC